MSRTASWLLFSLCAIAHTISANESVENTVSAPTSAPFTAFTGKIVKNKVRMRLHPDLDSTIIRDFHTDDLVIVVGNAGDYYAVEPPTDMKAYIFRTFVLDGVIEGKHVNVRLEPDLNSPVIAQLNSGDPIVGMISPKDKKWMEIDPPASTHFYIAKEYIHNIGDASLLAHLKARHDELMGLLNEARISSQFELQRAPHEANLEEVVLKLNQIITNYPDFPNEIALAKELLNQIQTAYFNMRVAYTGSADRVGGVGTTVSSTSSIKRSLNPKMATWIPVEQVLYQDWLTKNQNQSMDMFYKHQEREANTLHGVIEPYARNVKNRPGDYVLKSQTTRAPIAYLYSTHIDLDEHVGREVTLKAAPRNNQHFVHDAYFVLSIEDHH